jgi:hypothetical protein
MLFQRAYLRSLTKTSYLVALAILMIILATRDVPTVRATTFWYVAPNGSDASSCRTPATPCNAISTAIGRSADGDTIFLASGIYFETVTITKSLTLTGSGAAATAIDGRSSDRVLTIQAPAQVKISGLSIQNGNPGIYNYYGDVTLTNSTVRDNSPSVGPGGGIYNTGALTLVNSTVEDNFATLAGGGIYNSEGVVTINHSIIRNNTAAYTQSAFTASFGGGIVNNGTMVLNRTIVSGNQSYSSTSGLSSGGGIQNWGTLKLNDSTISYNRTVGSGAGIDNTGTVIIEGSTINGNAVGRFIPRSDGGFGGGINSSGLLTIINSTMSDNRADDNGGGIWNTGMITLTNVTMSNNSAIIRGGGISQVGGTIKLQNSILASNSNTAAPDCSGTLISQGYNLLGDNTGCTFVATTGDQVGTNTNSIDPRLGSLQENGGPTLTRQLLPNSPAIDAANPATPGSNGTTCPIADQRGFQRPQGNGCDIGAYEVGRTYFLPLVQY